MIQTCLDDLQGAQDLAHSNDDQGQLTVRGLMLVEPSNQTKNQPLTSKASFFRFATTIESTLSRSSSKGTSFSKAKD